MTVIANGKQRTLPDGIDVASALRALGLAPERVIVEHNGAALRRDRFASTPMSDGDRLEIAQMVGGG